MQKTGRLLIADETFGPCGIGAEISAQVMEKGFDDLDAPIARLNGAHTPTPYSPSRWKAPSFPMKRRLRGRFATCSPNRGWIMAIEIVMPKLGWTMEEGILDEWIKQDGDEVQPGDIIFVVESDKALQEIEAFDGGILRISPDAPPVGSTVKIGETLAYLVAPGEAPPFELAKANDADRRRLRQRPKFLTDSPRARTTKQVRRSRAGGPRDQPRAKRVALELGVDWSRLTGSGSSGRIAERDISRIDCDRRWHQHQSGSSGRIAQEARIALAVLAARGPGVGITRADVEKAAAERTSEAVSERQPLSRIRQLTRDRMLESARATAPVTLDHAKPMPPNSMQHAAQSQELTGATSACHLIH